MTFTDNGFLNIFKPVGMTSHDVVNKVRWSLGKPKTGHAGTLDPAACGVLVLLINKGTKASASAMGLVKTYRAEMTFGARTDSGDAQGEIVEERDVEVAEPALRGALEKFTGKIQQIPPMTSAIKVDGKKLYKLAHKGLQIERRPREVTIYKLSLIDFESVPESRRALMEIRCSSGTYVRTLVEDIAASIGAAAYTSFLIRTAVGPFHVEKSVLPDAITMETAEKHLLPMDFMENPDEENL